MPDRRLARDPLSDLLSDSPPGVRDDTSPPAAPESSRLEHSADSAPPRGAASSGRITVQLSDDLAEQVRDAVMWLHSVGVHTTISAIAAAGLQAELARLAAEHRSGRPFPPRHAEPPVGRPLK